MITSGPGNRAEIVAVAEPAARQAVRSGQTLPQARAVCPDIEVRVASPVLERTARETLLDVALSLAPRAEPAPRASGIFASEGVVFVDASGTTALHGNESSFASVFHARAERAGRFENLVVVGIGGSALGAIALRSALCHPFHNELPGSKRRGARLYVLDNADPARCGALLDMLDLRKTLFNVITKSGSTAETAAQFLAAREAVERTVGDSWREHFVFTTDAEKGDLRALAGSEGVTVSSLSATLHLTPPTVSDSLKALVRKGLLTRRRSPEDGRRVIFRPTPAGIESAQRIMAWAGPLEDSLDRMSTDELRAVMCGLTRLLHDRVREGYRVEEPMCANCADFEVISWPEGRFRCRARQSWLPVEGLRTDCPGHSPWEEGQRPS